MKNPNLPCVLTIAGTDPSGGAGIQADIKTISATGAYAASVITALVAQNTQGVQGIFEIAPEFIKQQLQSVISDLNLAAVKIGMLHNEKVMRVVAEFLSQHKILNIVFDPVMVAKNGCNLLQPQAMHFLRDNVLQHTTLITPNLAEAERLLDKTIVTPFAMAKAAQKLAQTYQINVLLKGGHLDSAQASDVYYDFATGQQQWFHADRIDTRNNHGTGCTLSAAIASYLAQGFNALQAIRMAKQYLTKALQAASHLKIGLGHGPVDHFYFLENRHYDIPTHA
jgi:hydroxymethylpyrimidine/phosphomethylpyrimidine kinase